MFEVVVTCQLFSLGNVERFVLSSCMDILADWYIYIYETFANSGMLAKQVILKH